MYDKTVEYKRMKQSLQKSDGITNDYHQLKEVKIQSLEKTNEETRTDNKYLVKKIKEFQNEIIHKR